MLVRLLDGCKLLAWGIVAGSCLVVAVISYRAPNSIWIAEAESPSLHVALNRDVILTQTVAWAGGSEQNRFVTAELPPPIQRPDFQDGDISADDTCFEVFSPPCRLDSDRSMETPPATDSDGLAAMSDGASRLAHRKSEFAAATPPDELTDDLAASAPRFDDGIRQSYTADYLAPLSKQEPFIDPQDQALNFAACNIQKLESCAATEVTRRKLTMRDATTNKPVATLTMVGAIASSRLPSEVIARAERLRARDGILHGAAGNARARQSFVNAVRNERTGHYTIEAQTTEITELASQLAEQFELSIVCHESAVGTVSAIVTDVTPIRALRRLVEPFGFAVVQHGSQIMIGDLEALKRPAQLDVSAYETQMFATQQRELPPGRVAVRTTYPVTAAAGIAAAGQTFHHTQPAVAVTPSARSLPPIADVAQVSHAMVERKPRILATPAEIAIGKQAKALVEEGMYSETIDLLTVAVREQTDSAILFRMLAEIYFHLDDLHPAESAAKRSLAIDKSNPLTNRIYGEILQRLGQNSRSKHYFRQADFLRFESAS
jgi:hypothetical protein